MRTIVITLLAVVTCIGSAYALDYERDYLGNRNTSTTSYQRGLNGSYTGYDAGGQQTGTWNKGLNGGYTWDNN